MALAIYFDELIRRGEVEDYAQLARIGRVSRARVTQIMDLLNLAPQIQEILLAATSGASERALRAEHVVPWHAQALAFSDAASKIATR
jgi:hypothetical protein